MIKDELKNLTPLGADDTEEEEFEWDENVPDDYYTDDEGYVPDDEDGYEEDDEYDEDDEDEAEPGDDAGIIISELAEYDKKIDLLRAYVGYYTEYDLEMMFDAVTLTDILTRYTYSQIRSRLINTKSNTLEAEFSIGDIVEILKPVMRYNIYEHDLGMIIGKHIVFDDRDRNRSPIYHTQYDIIVQTEQHIDGFSYEIKKEVAKDLILKEHTIDGVDKILEEFASYHIEKNV